MDEPTSPADFSKEVGTLAHPATFPNHAVPQRIVAGTRKRLCPTTTMVARVTKKRKAFVKHDKGTIISTGFYNERSRPDTVYPKTAGEGKTSSEQQIHGANLTCILDTGSDVNLLGRKHLKEFAKARIPYTVKEAETPLQMKCAFGPASETSKEIVKLSTLRIQTSKGPVEFKKI